MMWKSKGGPLPPCFYINSNLNWVSSAEDAKSAELRLWLSAVMLEG